MDSRLRGNDKEISITTQSWVSVILEKRSPSFPRRRESIGHHSDPHRGSFLELTEPSMSGSIFQAHLNSPRKFVQIVTSVRDGSKVRRKSCVIPVLLKMTQNWPN